MRRFSSVRLAAVAVLLFSVTSIAFIVAAMLDVVEVSLQQLPQDFTADSRIRRAAASAANDAVVVVGQSRRSVPQTLKDLVDEDERRRSVTAPASGDDAKSNDEDRRLANSEWLMEQLPPSDSASLWPSSTRSDGQQNDRILVQLKYIPRSYNRSNVKIIYLPSGLGDLPPGRKRFIKDRCPVDACSLTASSRHESTADIRLLQGDAFFDADVRKPPRQVWVLWLLESPQNSPHFRNAEGLINWTATYRSDSTIVTPYEKYVDFEALNLSPPDAGNRTTPRNWLRPSPSPPLPLLNDNAANGGGTRNPARRGFDRRRKMALSPMKNYAEGKTGLVAWFVSNCVASNRRYSYVQELRQYIPVDVYGDCGDLQCPRSHQIECDRLIRRRYKFYLAFENSNCEQYITEKFFRNALWNDVVPIVMGARRSDYEAVAPPHSFIHVDDFKSARDLANYLLRLNATDKQYNEYMAWKSPKVGQFVNTRFWCRLCALAHDDGGHVTWYDDVERWWRHPDTCVSGKWPVASPDIRVR